jgi:hypothetical protein
MGSYKEENRAWTAVRTSSYIGPSAKKDNDTVTTTYGSFARKESVRTMENNRISAISSWTKSIELNLSNGSLPVPRAMEEKKSGGSSSERNVHHRRDNSMTGGIMLKTTSATCIAQTNYNYPVVSVDKIGDQTPRSSMQVTPGETQEETDIYKQQKREHLRSQRDNLNWDLCNITNGGPNPPLERKESISTWKPALSKGADVEGLMTKVWNKQYKENELYISSMYVNCSSFVLLMQLPISVLGAEVNTTRSLSTTEVTIKIKGKALGTFPYGQEICLYAYLYSVSPY